MDKTTRDASGLELMNPIYELCETCGDLTDPVWVDGWRCSSCGQLVPVSLTQSDTDEYRAVSGETLRIPAP